MNITATHLVPILLLFFLSGPALPQDEPPGRPSPERMKEIKAQKTAYLTTKLGLGVEEAQRFWPIYNEFDVAREKIRSDMRELHHGGQGELSEEQARRLLESALANRQKEIELERTFHDPFVKAIGAVRTLELVRAEREFNREVLRRYREKMERRHDGPPGRR